MFVLCWCGTHFIRLMFIKFMRYLHSLALSHYYLLRLRSTGKYVHFAFLDDITFRHVSCGSYSMLTPFWQCKLPIGLQSIQGNCCQLAIICSAQVCLANFLVQGSYYYPLVSISFWCQPIYLKHIKEGHQPVSQWYLLQNTVDFIQVMKWNNPKWSSHISVN